MTCTDSSGLSANLVSGLIQTEDYSLGGGITCAKDVRRLTEATKSININIYVLTPSALNVSLTIVL